MKLGLMIIAAVISTNVMAAPGKPDLCGLVSRSALNAQKARNANLPNYEDSGTYVKYMVDGYGEYLKAKSPPIEEDRYNFHITAFTKQMNFVAKIVYQNSSSRDPKAVAEYANSMCLIDFDDQ